METIKLPNAFVSCPEPAKQSPQKDASAVTSSASSAEPGVVSSSTEAAAEAGASQGQGSKALVEELSKNNQWVFLWLFIFHVRFSIFEWIFVKYFIANAFSAWYVLWLLCGDIVSYITYKNYQWVFLWLFIFHVRFYVFEFEWMPLSDIWWHMPFATGMFYGCCVGMLWATMWGWDLPWAIREMH
jgi:hypothetical protein